MEIEMPEGGRNDGGSSSWPCQKCGAIEAVRNGLCLTIVSKSGTEIEVLRIQSYCPTCALQGHSVDEDAYFIRR